MIGFVPDQLQQLFFKGAGAIRRTKSIHAVERVAISFGHVNDRGRVSHGSSFPASAEFRVNEKATRSGSLTRCPCGFCVMLWLRYRFGP